MKQKVANVTVAVIYPCSMHFTHHSCYTCDQHTLNTYIRRVDCPIGTIIFKANCGTVIAEPFSQEQLNEVLRKALTQSPLRMAWAENARHYADTQDLYSLPEKAADIITGGLDG